jgi:hypothetical protein
MNMAPKSSPTNGGCFTYLNGCIAFLVVAAYGLLRAHRT